MIEVCSTKLSLNLPSASRPSFSLLWERSILPAISTRKPRATNRRPFASLARLFVFLCVGLSYFSFAGTVSALTFAPESIKSDTTWRRDAGPFVISSDLVVEKGAKLYIESDTTIAVSNNPYILIYGEIIFENGSSQKTIIDSTMHLSDEFPEFDDIASLGELYAYIIGGRADFTNINSKIPLHVQSDGGNVFIQDSRLSQSEITFINRAQGEINNSILESSDNVMLQGTSTLSVNGSSITSDLIRGSIFNIFKGSHIQFIKSEIIPLLSDFALILDGSSLSATSTLVSGMHSYGIQASRGSFVSLYDVSIDTILSPNPNSAFIMLVGSKADIKKSKFFNTTGNAIELYQSNGTDSQFSLDDSLIEDFGQSAISAVQAELSVKNSTIRRGAVGIENIFASTTVSNSNISENSQYGIMAYSPAFTVHAENNFWGDPYGPYHETLNKAGRGNAVSDNVFFIPWLTASPKSICCSSVLFLPGLEASRLYKTEDQGETRLWEPIIGGNLVQQLFMNDSAESLNPDIYTRDVIDEALWPFAGPNIYKSFIAMMNGLKEGGTIMDWEPIPYDWRLPLGQIIESGKKTGNKISYLSATSSPYIIQELKRLANNSKTGKVTLVAHSNGGLLAKALMIKLNQMGLTDLVDRIIFVAVPQIGTPQSIGVLLHGFGQSIPLILSAKTAMALAVNMPSAYNLLPSAPYFDSVSDPVIRFRESGTNIASSTLLDDFLVAKKLNPLLLKNSKATHKSLDTWLPPPDIEFIQIAGWGIDTVSGIEYYQGIKRGKPISQYKPIIVLDGDNTVVVPSALATATSTSNIQRYWFNLGEYNSKKEKLVNSRLLNRSHADILEAGELREFIVELIKKKDNLPKYFSTSTPSSRDDTRRLHFILHSPSVTLDMYDDQGNHTGISTTTNLIDEQIPNTFYREFGEVKYVSTNRSNGTRIIIKNRNIPIDSIYDYDSFTLDIDEVQNNLIASSTSFIDVPVKNQTTFTFDVSESVSSISSLKADENDDGSVDFYIAPGEIFTSPREFPESKRDVVIEGNIINQSNKPMGTEQTKSPIVFVDSTQTSGQSRRTTLRDIQELINDIKLPELTRVIRGASSKASSSIEIKVDDKVKEIENSQTASVFSGQPNRKNVLYSILSIIIAILKKILFWLIHLFT